MICIWQVIRPSTPHLADLGDEPGGREAFDKGKDSNSGAHAGQYGAFTSKQRLGTVITAFDVDIRPHRREKSMRPGLGEDDDGIDASQRGKDGGPLLLIDQRSPRTLEFTDGSVAVQADDKEVAKLPGALEITHMPEVQQIEAPVGGHDALAAAPGGRRPTRGLRQR